MCVCVCVCVYLRVNPVLQQKHGCITIALFRSLFSSFSGAALNGAPALALTGVEKQVKFRLGFRVRVSVKG